MTFDPDRYDREVIRPLRKHRGRLPDGDLATRYAVEPGMDAVALKEHLRRVRAFWNQKANGPTTTAQVCTQLLAADEKLQRSAGIDMLDPAWWQDRSRERGRAVAEGIERLAGDLATAYGSVGLVTPEQLDGVLTHVPGLAKEHVAQAVARAGLRVAAPVELPAASGLDKTAYRSLNDRLGELGAHTIVQLLHPDLTAPFSLIGGFRVAGRPELRLDAATVADRGRAAEQAADSQQLRARKAALGVLRTGQAAGADLATVALFQIVDRIRDGRGRGVPDPILVRTATGLGLATEDAQQVVISLPAGVPVRDTAAEVRQLLEDGQLHAAEAAVAAMALDAADRAELSAQVGTVRAEVERLVRQSRRAVTEEREEDAERLLRRAAALAGDDAAVRRALDRLPPPPPGDLVAVEDGWNVRVSWREPATSHEHPRYLVVRSEGRPAASPAGGTRICETTASGATASGASTAGAATAGTGATEASDTDPPVARPLFYTVFTLAGGGVSRPAAVSLVVRPGLMDVDLRTSDGSVSASWCPHPATKAVRVHRTTGRPPRTPRDGVPVTASLASFTDQQITEGDEYFYGLTAVYHDASGREVLSAMVVLAASPQAPALPVDGLSVVPVRSSGNGAVVRLTWPMTPHPVRIRRAEGAPPWEYGATIPPPDIDRYGREVAGAVRVDGAQHVMEAEVPGGSYCYVPFAVGGTGAVVGRGVTQGLADPVQRLQLRRTGDQAILTWTWPTAAGMADVTWSTPEHGESRRTVTRAQYRDENGCRLPVGTGGGTATVRTVVAGPLGRTMSLAETANLPGRAVRVSYTIARPARVRDRLSRPRARVVELVAEAACPAFELVVVVVPGNVMPLAPGAGGVVGRFEVTGLPGAGRAGFDIEIPRGVRGPYWVRCFAEPATAVTLVDPPITIMKVA